MVEGGQGCHPAFLESGSRQIWRGSGRVYAGYLPEYHSDASSVRINAGDSAAPGLSVAQAGTLHGGSGQGEDQCSCDFAVLLEIQNEDDYRGAYQ